MCIVATAQAELRVAREKGRRRGALAAKQEGELAARARELAAAQASEAAAQHAAHVAADDRDKAKVRSRTPALSTHQETSLTRLCLRSSCPPRSALPPVAAEDTGKERSAALQTFRCIKVTTRARSLMQLSPSSCM